MKVRYYHNTKNKEGYIETEVEEIKDVESIWFENLDYCDNPTWFMVNIRNQKKAKAIFFGTYDEFEILGE